MRSNDSGIEETDRAVEAARAALPGWRVVKPADRARLLRRLATLVEGHGEELAWLETRNAGKPIADSRGEMAMVADVFHYYSGAVERLYGETKSYPELIDVLEKRVDLATNSSVARALALRAAELRTEHTKDRPRAIASGRGSPMQVVTYRRADGPRGRRASPSAH